MSLHMKHGCVRRGAGRSALLLPALASAAPTPLVAPGHSRRRGASRPDRTRVDAGRDHGHPRRRRPTSDVAGTKFTHHRAPGCRRTRPSRIVWSTANVTWVVDARPDSVDYLGRKADKINVVLAQTTDRRAAAAFAVAAEGAEGLRRHPRHLRRRRRHRRSRRAASSSPAPRRSRRSGARSAR